MSEKRKGDGKVKQGRGWKGWGGAKRIDRKIRKINGERGRGGQRVVSRDSEKGGMLLLVEGTNIYVPHQACACSLK